MTIQTADAPSRIDLTEAVFRLAGVATVVWFVLRIGGHWWRDPTDLTLLLFMTSEVVTLVIMILAHKASHRDASPFHGAVAVVASFMVPLFIQATDDTAVLPCAVTAIATAAGIVWVIWAKVSLGRSFGILAAARTLRTSGPYRWVRHPIYVGYLITHLAFLAANFTTLNVCVIVLLYQMQIVRAMREEKVLASVMPGYADYMERVPHRFVPGLV